MKGEKSFNAANDLNATEAFFKNSLELWDAAITELKGLWGHQVNVTSRWMDHGSTSQITKKQSPFGWAEANLLKLLSEKNRNRLNFTFSKNQGNDSYFCNIFHRNYS